MTALGKLYQNSWDERMFCLYSPRIIDTFSGVRHKYRYFDANFGHNGDTLPLVNNEISYNFVNIRH